jgi:hypothetical protein
MFLDNKFSRWYFAIVESARIRKLDPSIYVERHHVVPKCMAGDNSIGNIVSLTAREHFICHWLLTKMVESTFHKRKMYHALGKFVQSSPLQQRNLSSRQYDVARNAISEARRGRKHTVETRQKMSRALKGRASPNKGRKGWFSHSAVARDRISSAVRGKTFVDRFGEEKAMLAKEKLRQSKLGKPSGMLGKRHSPETIEKLSKPKNGSPHRRTTCPYCNALEQTPRHIRLCAP